jgi:hypothetical protein
MASSGMLRRAAHVRSDVSKECVFSIIRVTRIGELGTTLAVTSNRSTQRRNCRVFLRSVLYSYKKSYSHTEFSFAKYKYSTSINLLV